MKNKLKILKRYWTFEKISVKKKLIDDLLVR